MDYKLQAIYKKIKKTKAVKGKGESEDSYKKTFSGKIMLKNNTNIELFEK